MNNESLPERLILASTSKYRKLLLRRLGLPFDCVSPETDEIPLKDELPSNLVSRLASLKAGSVALMYPDAVVIGSDQLAVLDSKIMAKPGTHAEASKQLSTCSGQRVEFLTAVTVKCQQSGFCEQFTDLTRVCFRELRSDEIESYLRKEKPYDCAGSFKSEALGIVLFDRVITEDPSALIGLPLIHTAALLRSAGFKLP